MAQVKYYLDRPNLDSTYVKLSYHFSGKRLNYATGISVPPKYWNKETQRVKKTSKYPQHSEINSNLNKLASSVETIYLRFKNQDKIPSIKEFKLELDIDTLKTERDTQNGFYGFIKSFITEREKNKTVVPKTIAQYKVVESILKDYDKNLDFQDITLEFYNNFMAHLQEELIFSVNYCGNIIKNLKTFLNEATEKGYNKTFAFRSKYFKKTSEEVESIYLTVPELTKIFNLDLTNEKLNNVRDCFLIGSFTGLRYSDFSRLTLKNIQKVYDKNGSPIEVISITTQKTNTPVKIPLHPIVKAILIKRDGIPPQSYSNQKMNDYIKDVAKLAKMTEQIQLKRGKVIRTYEKWEKVATHTARRSFATNAYKAGVPSISIMKITGHKTEKAFLKYIKITQDENAVMLSNSAFFNTTPLRVAK